ncbi:MAG: hypothetical protein Q8942_12155 [Bacillota bacterium]|nr:hypothetical protein [Bacillota bacterium]
MESLISQIKVNVFPQILKGVIKGSITAIKSDNGSLLALSVNESQLHIYEGKSPSECKLSVSVKNNIKNPGGLIKLNEDYLVVDSVIKAVYKLNKEKQIMEPMTLLKAGTNNTASAILNAPGCCVNDMDHYENKIWFVCMAGYSSCVCTYDINSNQVKFKFFTKGSRPNGILFDREKEHLVVIDSYKNILNTYNIDGKVVNSVKGSYEGGIIKDGLSKKNVAKGLALDINRNLWVLNNKLRSINKVSQKEGRI